MIDFLDNFSVSVVQSTSGAYELAVEKIGANDTQTFRTFIKPNGLKFKEVSSDTVKIYYSTKSSSGENILTAEIADNKENSLSLKETNVGNNCANQIKLYDKLVILACTTVSSVILSVYRENDMKLMFNKNDDSTMLATTVRALSTDSYYQIIYNSYSSTPDNGTLTIVDILPNNKNPNLFTNIVRKNEIYDTAFIKYGLFFDVDSEGMAYISAHSDYNTTLVNPINVMRLCTHNQKYDSSSQTCVATSTSSITFGLQDTSEVACSNVDDSIEYNRNVAESVCNYNCADNLFGKKCESCDNYLTRLKKYFQMYQKNYYNLVDKTCSIVDDAEYCSKHTRCIECFSVKGCVYSNNLCVKGAAYNKTFNPLEYISQCPKNEEPNDTTLCSKSQRDLDTMDFTKLMPQNSIIPNGTVCVYNITSSKKIYRDLKFTIDQNANLIITQSINGVMKTVEPKSTRNLNSSERELASVTQTYSITGADSISMSYMSNGESTSLVSVLGPDTEPCDYPPLAPTNSSSEPQSSPIIPIIVSTVVVAVLLFAIALLLFFCRKKIFPCFKKPNKNLQNNRQSVYKVKENDKNPEKLKGYSDNILPVDNINNCFASNMKNLNCNRPILEESKESFGICVICQDSLEKVIESNITTIPECKHKYHKSCFKKKCRA